MDNRTMTFEDVPLSQQSSCLNITAKESCGLGADFKLSNSSLAVGITFMCIALLGVPGNLLVIAICFRKTSAMYRTYMLALAIVDSSICVFFIISSLLDILVWSEASAEIRCPFSLTNVIFCTCLTYSVFVLTLISVDRFLAVHSPIKHRSRTMLYRTMLAVLPVAAFLISIGLAVLEYLWIPYLNEFVAFLPFVICSIIIIVMYTLLACIVYKRQKLRQQHTIPALIISPVLPREPQENKLEKIAKTLFTVTVVFIVCWLPFWLITLGVSLPCEFKETYIFNSVINPLIYAFMWDPFMHDAKQLFKRKTKVHPFLP